MKTNHRKTAEELYKLMTKLEDWTGGRQEEANVTRIAQYLESSHQPGVDKGIKTSNSGRKMYQAGQKEERAKCVAVVEEYKELSCQQPQMNKGYSMAIQHILEAISLPNKKE